MPSVLIVEDSLVVTKILRHIASQVLTFDVFYADSAEAARKQVESRDDWFAAIVDLNLPDAPNGEMVDYMLQQKIPTIVLTGRMFDENRDALLRQGIVDYVQKEGLYSYQYCVNLVNRLYRNRDIKVLVAEDSSVTRSFITELLRRHQFQVVEAADGQKALKAILADPEIDILLTDYNMPVMNGFELIHALRHQHEKVDLVVIGLSSAEDKYLSAKFIKNGANDFLYKPFSHEEFFCRIMHAVDGMERKKELLSMAYRDTLTGIHNRRYFVQQSRKMIAQAQSGNTPLTFAIMDIDFFKSINDSYGHDVGDLVLIAFAKILQESLGRFLIARTGGEEFCVLFPGLAAEKAARLLDAVRKQVEESFVETPEGEISFTFSSGLSQLPADNLEVLMKEADIQLYNAKDNGRNCVCF
ncbi:GGDEF domain-containing response regulator [Marinobacter salinexigens]|nr:diguanylate cyclase [Marinobacter salinexigens]